MSAASMPARGVMPCGLRGQPRSRAGGVPFVWGKPWQLVSAWLAATSSSNLGSGGLTPRARFGLMLELTVGA
jgi:hypothetical protein